ncbi:MAG: bestrophin family protein [Bacteroidia bacterium]|jgi:putative membrane protein
MVKYNPREWFLLIFKFHKADTFRTLFPLIISIGMYSGIIAWLELEVWKLSDTSHVKNLSLIHSALGMVISMLLVFRTNTAYERWWEGRKIWGSLVNSSRNLALKISSIIPQEANYFAAMIPNYAFAMKNHLRVEHHADELEETHDFKPQLHSAADHVPNHIAQSIMKRMEQLRAEGKLLPEHLLFFQSELNNFTEAVGACERIRKTPIPFSYSVFLKKFIFLYIMTLPFGFVFSLGYWVVPVVSIIFYVLASLELIAEEIEDPFGNDANDLPTDEIALGIRMSVRQILVGKMRAEPF